jgi:hypothetical protein
MIITKHEAERTKIVVTKNLTRRLFWEQLFCLSKGAPFFFSFLQLAQGGGKDLNSLIAPPLLFPFCLYLFTLLFGWGFSSPSYLSWSFIRHHVWLIPPNLLPWCLGFFTELVALSSMFSGFSPTSVAVFQVLRSSFFKARPMFLRGFLAPTLHFTDITGVPTSRPHQSLRIPPPTRLRMVLMCQVGELTHFLFIRSSTSSFI